MKRNEYENDLKTNDARRRQTHTKNKTKRDPQLYYYPISIRGYATTDAPNLFFVGSSLSRTFR